MSNQNLQLLLTACNFDVKQTQNGTKINVMMLFNDMIYVKGELKTRKDNSGMWLEVANVPWKTEQGKWNNNYRAGFANEDFKKNIEALVIANYQSGALSTVMPTMRTNYDAATYLHPRVPNQAPPPPAQQFNQQNYQKQQAPPQQFASQPQGYAQPQGQQQAPSFPGYTYNNNNSPFGF